MPKSDKKPHPFRIFFISGLITILGLGMVAGFLGPEAFIIAGILVVVELAFSFDNAIINAKVLATLSPLWRKLFLTVGIIVAVIGMRLLFPILIVAITTGLSFSSVVNLAVYHQNEYAAALQHVHVAIAAFGGMFLLLLSLQFFFDDERDTHWIRSIERPLQRIGKWWLYLVVGLLVLAVLVVVPANHEPHQTLIAGLVGAGIYVAIHGLTSLLGKGQVSRTSGRALKTGTAAFVTFIYLQVLDASFSFDGVIGAFAVTKDVLLIGVGLGIGAVWVRSMTVFMVERDTLSNYRFLEHGAHYTIAVLAGVLLGGIFFDVPEAVAGVAGVIIIGSSIVSSVVTRNKR